MDADYEILREFVTEGRELIDDVEPLLIELSQAAADSGSCDEEKINAVFRLFHSLKGSAGFLDLENISSLTHEAETLLDLVRGGKMALTPGLTSTLCRGIDQIQVMLRTVEEDGTDAGYEDQNKALIAELSALASGEAPAEPEPAPAAAAPQPQPEPAPAAEEADAMPEFHFEITPEMKERFVQEAVELLENTEQSFLEIEKDPSICGELIEEAFRNIHSFKGNCGFMSLTDLESVSHACETFLDAVKTGDVKMGSSNLDMLLNIVDTLRGGVEDLANGGDGAVPGGDVMASFINDVLATESGGKAEEAKSDPEPKPERAVAKAEAASPAATEPAPTSPAAPAKRAAPKSKAKTSKGKLIQHDIRVSLDKLDRLINLVGELVTAESMVTRNPDIQGLELENFERAAHHMHRIITDLQDVALAARMIPVSTTFRKMIRLVHDVSQKAGKKVQLELAGEETEIDKTVIEKIADPLVHIVRNSVDHGIETPEERMRLGKRETGKVLLSARHEAGEVWIEITDDGKGLDRDKILAKAIERGLVTSDGSELDDSEVFEMIFAPGFSTADQVTDISGRGVGMDVVKRNIEELKGRVSVRSRVGRGSTVTLRIPLTLAIIEGMMLRVGVNRYTVPLLTIRETVRPEKGDITVTPTGREVVRIRDELLPVLRLHDRFRVKPDFQDLDQGILIVVSANSKSLCLFADEVLGQHQTVIKGLSNYMGNVRGVSGCTILGNGSISLILDVVTLVDSAKIKANELLEAQAATV